jgi:leucyl aminopeptidase
MGIVARNPPCLQRPVSPCRPLDVLQTRARITVENGNTDAEGRLILCDALAEAVEERPDLLVDAATLTGAARVALGTELPALFCNDDAVASELLSVALEVDDPLWRLPLHTPYRKMLDSKVADINSCGEGGYGGAITAALFLYEFVKESEVTWCHIDTMAYNLSSKPGRPEGGEAFGLRALFEFIKRKYAMQ